MCLIVGAPIYSQAYCTSLVLNSFSFKYVQYIETVLYIRVKNILPDIRTYIRYPVSGRYQYIFKNFSSSVLNSLSLKYVQYVSKQCLRIVHNILPDIYFKGHISGIRPALIHLKTLFEV